MSAEYANSLHQQIVELSPLLPFVVGPAGLAFVVWITRKFFPGSQGSGIPQTIAAIDTENEELRGNYLSIRLALGKFLLTVVGLF